MKEAALRIVVAGLIAGLAVIAGAISTSGQASPPARGEPAFEVASIKRNTSGSDNSSLRPRPGGGVAITNGTIRSMIRNAWDLREFQIVGGPEWLASERYDVLAKGPAGAQIPQLMAMLRSLLVERFELVTHRETRPLPIYALVMARRDRRPGAQLRPSVVDCEALIGAAGGARVSLDGVPGAPSLCGTRVTRGRLLAGGMPMSRIAATLSAQAGRLVLDKTGLPGTFDLTLEWSPDPGGADLSGGDGASLFTAVQEQLDLKLEPGVGPVEVLVIDSVRRPSED